MAKYKIIHEVPYVEGERLPYAAGTIVDGDTVGRAVVAALEKAMATYPGHIERVQEPAKADKPTGGSATSGGTPKP